METKRKLWAVLEYLASNRGVGHTKTLLNGCKATKVVLLTHNHNYGDELARQFGIRQAGGRVISWAGLTGDSLNGIRGFPLAVDNGGLTTILHDAIMAIETAESQSRTRLEEIEKLRALVTRLRGQAPLYSQEESQEAARE